MRSRNEVEAAFGKLPTDARRTILAEWGFKAFGEIPGTMMEGVSLDIVANNPSAFGMVAASGRDTRKPDTAAKLNALADATYANKTEADQPEDVELNPRQPGGGIFSGSDAVIDAAEIFARYNKATSKRLSNS